MLKKIIIGLIALILVAVGIGAVFGGPANATEGDEPCVPQDAWTETIEHPAVTHVVHHDAVTHVVHHDAVTHEETVIDEPEVWANFQPNNIHEPFVGPAVYPNDERGSWNVHDKIPGGHEGPDGVYFKGNPAKGGNWFYRHAEVSHTETVVDQEAYDETVVDQEAYDETVVDQEAWTEVIEHPAVTCTPEQPDPLVTETSSTSYHCGDNTQTTTHVVTTTEYVWDEESQEWVLGEPVSVTTTTTETVPVVPCDTPDEPDNPDNPTEIPAPHIVKHHTTVINNAVPTVIDAGL